MLIYQFRGKDHYFLTDGEADNYLFEGVLIDQANNAVAASIRFPAAWFCIGNHRGWKLVWDMDGKALAKALAIDLLKQQRAALDAERDRITEKLGWIYAEE